MGKILPDYIMEMAVDTQRGKTILDSVQKSISRINSPEFDATISETQLNLYNLLGADTEVSVDKNVKEKFKKIYERL